MRTRRVIPTTYVSDGLTPIGYNYAEQYMISMYNKKASRCQRYQKIISKHDNFIGSKVAKPFTILVAMINGVHYSE